MKLSEAKEIRAEIIRLCPKSTHKARNISVRVMRALANEREDVAGILGGSQHLAQDYDIEDRYAVQLERALRLAKEHRTSLVAKAHVAMEKQDADTDDENVGWMEEEEELIMRKKYPEIYSDKGL